MDHHPLEFLVRKLRTRAPIGSACEAAILALPYTRKSYDPPAYLVREGSTDLHICSMIVSGYAFRQRVTVEGRRQILSLHMRGDLPDLQNLFLKRSDHSIQALTQLQTLNIERTALQRLVLQEPEAGRAIWIDTLIDASIYRDWITNVGRRDAKARIAHLLCEFAARSKVAGLGADGICLLPMTQEQIGDAVGLTNVHVNRTLKALEQDGVIKRNKREIWFTNWDDARRAGDFTSIYLHLEQIDTAD